MATSAEHRPRAFWADLRFLLGVLLVLASVAGVWFVVIASRQTVPILVATQTLVPGQTIDQNVVQAVEVSLGPVEGRYLGADEFDEKVVAIRTIEAGELVSNASIGAAELATTTTIVLNSAADVPEAVGKGSRVEVWQAPVIERGRYDVPRVLIADATVIDVVRDDSLVGGQAAAVELVIDRSEVSDAFAAVASGAAISVVPLAGQAS